MKLLFRANIFMNLIDYADRLRRGVLILRMKAKMTNFAVENEMERIGININVMCGSRSFNFSYCDYCFSCSHFFGPCDSLQQLMIDF